jgi:hypothetical protein
MTGNLSAPSQNEAVFYIPPYSGGCADTMRNDRNSILLFTIDLHTNRIAAHVWRSIWGLHHACSSWPNIGLHRRQPHHHLLIHYANMHAIRSDVHHVQLPWDLRAKADASSSTLRRVWTVVESMPAW